MSDQSNLPALRQYGKIKEVTIKKGINVDTHKRQFEYYYISFVEIVEKEEEQRILFKKKKVIVSEEVKRIVPFSFKSLEDAKDFAQYLPGMSLKGFRFYKDFNNVKFNISYETYKILIENIDTPIYIKFTKVTEHPRIYSKRKNGEMMMEKKYETCCQCDTTKHIKGIMCDVKNCAYHYGKSECCAVCISVGPSSAESSSATACVTFKPRTY
jgi:hypothetical protein